MASSSTKPLDTEDDIDPETIQSAADVSLSLALNMVQSWMPAASSFSVDPSIAESRKKLEEYMRRPPRLGVGAPIPSSAAQNQTQATHHEAQRLKNRLVGSGAARRRAEDAKLNGPNKDGSSSDQDESESRASAVKKNGKLGNAKSNGLSVFGSTSAIPKATPTPTPRLAAIPSDPPSTPARSSSSTSPGKSSSPSQLNNSPEEPMGIHTLPPKLSLAAKIWPRLNSVPSPSSTGPDRPTKRRKVAPMLPPLAPDMTWNMHPRLSLPLEPRGMEG
ncbi:hypothetical protein FRC08_002577 [Ceratobasidium sp. 394]|nr:hypothetical protein FRC08_002577 [Ceratobasidium sp. 394]